MTKERVIAACAVLFAAGVFVGCICNCNRIATVDVVAVVSKSPAVQALKNEQSVKAQELAAWLKNAEAEVEKESDKAKKEEMLQQYRAEFAQKRNAVSEKYNQDLQAIDSSISQTITDVAKKKGYKIVLNKSEVLSGGTDLTEEIAKAVK